MADFSSLLGYNVKDALARENIQELSTNLKNTNQNILDLADTISGYRNANRKFILIGDSYGMRHEKNWAYHFARHFDVLASNCQSGTGFAEYEHAAYTFLDLITQTTATLTDEQKDSVTDIVVCGGWNDARSITTGSTIGTVQTALITFCQYCEQNYPNAIIHVGFIGWQLPDNAQNEATFEALRLAEKVYTYTGYKNLHNLQNVNYIMKNAYFMDSSKFHPNDTTGAEMLYYGISRALFGGFDFRLNYNLTADNLENVSEIVKEIPFIKCSVHNGIAKMQIGITIASGTVINSHNQDLFTFKDFTLPFDYSFPVRFAGTVFANIDNKIDVFPAFGSIGTSKKLTTILPKGSYNADSTLIFDITVLTDYTC